MLSTANFVLVIIELISMRLEVYHCSSSSTAYCQPVRAITEQELVGPERYVYNNKATNSITNSVYVIYELIAWKSASVATILRLPSMMRRTWR